MTKAMSTQAVENAAVALESIAKQPESAALLASPSSKQQAPPQRSRDSAQDSRVLKLKGL